MHFGALRGPKSKKLRPQTLTKMIKFGTKYQILGFSVSKSFFWLFAQPPFYSTNRDFNHLLRFEDWQVVTISGRRCIKKTLRKVNVDTTVKDSLNLINEAKVDKSFDL